MKLGIFTMTMLPNCLSGKIMWPLHSLLLALSILLLMTLPAQSQTDFTKVSLEWRYQPQNISRVDYKVAKDDSLYHIFFSVGMPPGNSQDEQVDITYEIRSSFDSQEILIARTVNYAVSGIGAEQGLKYYHIEVPDANNYNLLLLNIKDRRSGKSYTWDIPLVSGTEYSPPDFMIYDGRSVLPVCRNFMGTDDLLRLKDLSGNMARFFVYYYNTDFDVADPPMYRIKRTVSKSMEIDSTFTLYTDSTFAFDREGLYFIQSDTSSFSGIGIRIENDFYPRLRSIEELSKPLIYLSTKEEIDKLLSSDNIRSSFETFWLTLTRSEESARILIKNFYARIEESNLLFTNYKEGWKTDMGMLYTVVGPPDEVYRTEEKESWYYKNPGKNQIVVFNFLKLKNLFSDNHYMLIRDNQYRSFWFKSIDTWRKGTD